MSKNLFDFMEPQRWNSPVVRYWWYRKEYQVINLINRHLNLFLNQINISSTSPLFVDIGCGKGTDLFLYHHYFEKNIPGWHFVGVEGDPSSIDSFIGNQKYFGANNVDIIPGNLAKPLPFKTNEVDLLYCSEVIEHLENPEFILDEIKRVLKPNGYLILTTPNEPNIFQRSYWLPKHREKIKTAIQQNIDSSSPFTVNVNGEEVTLHGHISVRTIKEWETTLHKMGFKTIDYGRGSALYGHNPIFDNSWILAAFFLLEALLDTFPRRLSRNLSSQLIGLYSLEDQSE
ncbi:MAG: hypothetical protein RLZZ507_973 [Cyanobacteriota bacterium]